MATSKWTKDRLVERLTWFSFHVPAIVLEYISKLNVQEEKEEISRSMNGWMQYLNEEGEEDEIEDFDIDTHLHIQEMRLVEMWEVDNEEEEEEENNSKPEDSKASIRWTTNIKSSSVRKFDVQNSSRPCKMQKRVTVDQVTNIPRDLSVKEDLLCLFLEKYTSEGEVCNPPCHICIGQS
mmetsp:Transcript_43032/g.52215  ORF Transcript_43032/g.52215 Transcript_43032/m.52215 type:complete len:179 (-) Transcript_43032:186-722(-)|eukprot:CAMPEP_0172486382 /NCGR_PEP_ID=MMETSP1066-20121228/14945_1 /TAXON_ID=671091 /ORGANISM="Coscinodiscus wailesii, Strain CCMP2513" /LENGTH=178 /DNA_ID=CAMNT_0013252297 /DNA_START=444 /DNA_END=980 /DNA_ORIENTATION=-